MCERHWPRGRREDFERTGRRDWTDTTTGIGYREVGGCGPLLSPEIEAVDLWFISEGRLILLRRGDRPAPGARTVCHGPIVSRQVG